MRTLGMTEPLVRIGWLRASVLSQEIALMLLAMERIVPAFIGVARAANAAAFSFEDFKRAWQSSGPRE